MPAHVTVLLTTSLLASGFLTVMVPQLRNASHDGTPPLNPLDARAGRVWLAVGIAFGSAFSIML
jgi:hypothetical protein